MIGKVSLKLVKLPQQIYKRNIISYIQHGLTEFQALSGLPWWATIASATVIVKTSLLPLVRLQMLASQRLAKAIPDINSLRLLLVQSLVDSTNTPAQKIEALKTFFRGAGAALTIHNASISSLLFYPLANMAAFITFVYSIRTMLDNNPTGPLSKGGMLWFRDLCVADDTMILPFAAITATYLTLELSFRGGAGPMLLFFKDALQCLVIICAPITVTLPAGVFCYWIPSSLFGMLQIYLLRKPSVMKLLKIPVSPRALHKIPID